MGKLTNKRVDCSPLSYAYDKNTTLSEQKAKARETDTMIRRTQRKGGCPSTRAWKRKRGIEKRGIETSVNRPISTTPVKSNVVSIMHEKGVKGRELIALRKKLLGCQVEQAKQLANK